MNVCEPQARRALSGSVLDGDRGHFTPSVTATLRDLSRLVTSYDEARDKEAHEAHTAQPVHMYTVGAYSHDTTSHDAARLNVQIRSSSFNTRFGASWLVRTLRDPPDPST